MIICFFHCKNSLHALARQLSFYTKRKKIKKKNTWKCEGNDDSGLIDGGTSGENADEEIGEMEIEDK